MVLKEIYENDEDVFISSELIFEKSTNFNKCILKLNPNYEIESGNEVKLYDFENNLVFYGEVFDIIEYDSKEIQLYDITYKLKRVLITEIFLNKKPEEIIEHIITNYTPLTFVSSVNSIDVIERRRYSFDNAHDIIQEMLDTLLSESRIDPNGIYYVEKQGYQDCIHSLSDLNARILDGWTENSSEIYNEIIVEGESHTYETTKLFSGNGTNKIFTLDDYPDMVYIEHPLGTELQPGNISGQYKVLSELKQIEFTTAPASGTNNIQIKYSYNKAIRIKATDNTSIIKYGKKEKKFEMNHISDINSIRLYARSLLSIYSKPLFSSSWIPFNQDKWRDYYPNMNISINDDIFNKHGVYYINKVERNIPGGLQLFIGENTNTIIDWNKEVSNRISKLENKRISDDTLQYYEHLKNKINLQINTNIRSWERISTENDILKTHSEIPGLIAYYKLNESLINSADTNYNSVWLGTPNWGDGHQFDSSASFTGSNRIHTSLRVGSGPKTYSLWIKTNSIVPGSRLMSQRNTGQFGDFVIDIYGSGGVRFLSWQEETTTNLFRWRATNNEVLTLNTWVHVLCEFTGTNHNIYINNVKSDTAGGSTAATHGNSSYNLTIGGDGTSNYINAFIGDVRIYDRVLSEGERAYIYNEGEGLLNNCANTISSIHKNIDNLLFWWDMNNSIKSKAHIENNLIWFNNSPADLTVSPIYPYTFDFQANNRISTTSPNLTISNGASFSICLWVNPSLPTSNLAQNVINLRPAGLRGIGLRTMNYGSDSLYGFGMRNDAGTSEITFWSKSTSVDKWRHIVLSYDGTTMTVHVDGNFINSTTGRSVPIPTEVFIGGLQAYAGNTEGFIGKISDLRIYNRYLTLKEIQSIYNYGKGSIDNCLFDRNDKKWILTNENTYSRSPKNELKGQIHFYPLSSTSNDLISNNNGTNTNITFTNSKANFNNNSLIGVNEITAISFDMNLSYATDIVSANILGTHLVISNNSLLFMGEELTDTAGNYRISGYKGDGYWVVFIDGNPVKYIVSNTSLTFDSIGENLIGTISLLRFYNEKMGKNEFNIISIDKSASWSELE